MGCNLDGELQMSVGMAGHALSTCSVLMLCLLGNAITGCGQATLSVDDAVLLEGQQTRFIGYLEREPLLGIRDGIEGARIRFFIDGREVGCAGTDGDGGSSIACDVDADSPSRFEARAILAGQRLRSEGIIFNWRGDRVIIVVDIDGTIARTEFDDLIFDEEDDESKPVRHAQETLRELSADFHIGYVTARPRFLLDKTRRWLARNAFPPGAGHHGTPSSRPRQANRI